MASYSKIGFHLEVRAKETTTFSVKSAEVQHVKPT